MEIVFQNHDAPVSDAMLRRAEQALRKAVRRGGGRAQRPVDAVIRFQQDGAVRRVELAVHTSTGRRLVAHAEARYFGTALTAAARRLTQQFTHAKRTPRAKARRQARRAGAA